MRECEGEREAAKRFRATRTGRWCGRYGGASGEMHGVLEHKQMLIQEIGQTHEAHEADGLNYNVALIRELNANMARIANLYSEFSSTLDATDATKKTKRPPTQYKK